MSDVKVAIFNNINKRAHYNISPQIVPADAESEITIGSQYGFTGLAGTYRVHIWPLYEFSSNAGKNYGDTIIATAENKELKFKYHFQSEQMHLLQLYKVPESGQLENILITSIYSLHPDLFQRRPYKGDLHTHTTYSDGLEPPEVMLACARKKGLDFIAITDHNNYHGSLDAINKLERIPSDMVALRGQEINSWWTQLHILSLDADKEIEPSIYLKEAYTLPEVQMILAEEGDSLPQGVDPVAYSCIKNILNKIREAGGFSVLCHPFWKSFSQDGSRLDVPKQMVDLLLSNKLFDVFELVSGAPPHQSFVNNLQDIYFKECSQAEPNFPVIGVTDSHTGLLDESILGNYYTLVFCVDFSPRGIREAILSGYSLAVEEVPNEGVRFHGNFRLSNYAFFLTQEYFPRHAVEAGIEGEAALRYIRGETDYAEKLLKLQKGRTAKLFDQLKNPRKSS